MDSSKQRVALLERHIQRLDRQIVYWQKQSARLTRWRLMLFLAGTAVSLLTLWQWGLWPWASMTALVIFSFALTIRQHHRVENTLTQFRLWRQLKQTHVARIQLDWQAMPPAAPLPVDADHPFARDLDIVGPRSLHRLLDTAVSLPGSLRLGEWLLETSPNPAQTAARQALVQELTPLAAFRDRLILHAAMSEDEPETAVAAHEKWPGQRMVQWLSQPQATAPLRRTLLLLSPFSGLAIMLLLASLVWPIGPWWLVPWTAYVLLTGVLLRQAGNLFGDAAFLADGLRKLQAIFHLLEQFNTTQRPHLHAFCQPFKEAKRPSVQLRQVSRILAAAGLRYNPALWLLLNAFLPWDIYFAYRMAQSRQELENLLPRWLDAWYQLEAASSLAHFAYLHPQAVYPSLTTSTTTPLFQAQALGHPLIPTPQRVCNDISFPQPGHIYLITGSNMAGKSTFLRTVGINLCLAYAGGPVVAQRLQATFFRLHTSIQVTDSLADGFSSFYAEVRRLQALLVALQAPHEMPLMFLIDEIFRGTNNRERLMGSRAYVRALAGGNGVGAIATHDLELVNLANVLPGLQNSHFRDDVENGRMVFDYTLHPGPCPTTNALKIMALAGLPVPETGANAVPTAVPASAFEGR